MGAELNMNVFITSGPVYIPGSGNPSKIGSSHKVKIAHGGANSFPQ